MPCVAVWSGELEMTESHRLPVVLHVAESFAAGVRTAMLEYIRSTPMIEHIVVGADRGEPLPENPDGYRFIAMVEGQLARIRQVRELCRTLEPTVVHAHSSFAGLYVRVASGRVPVVYTPHCFGFERTDLRHSARGALWVIERVLALRTAEVAACSPREAQLARRMGMNVTSVPNVGRFEGLDLEHSTRGSAGRVPKVSFVGRISAQKDPKFAAETVREFRELHVGQVDFEWIGDGPQEACAGLERAGIRVTGWLSGEQVTAELSGSSVYVHTAAWEGFPMAVLEASQLGLPIVARDIPALDQMPRDYLGGDPKTVAAIIVKVLTSTDTENRCAAGWSDALTANTRDNQRSALLAVYARATGRNAREA
jgi:glycosyltransferase involved in cell wall biosynthesis